MFHVLQSLFTSLLFCVIFETKPILLGLGGEVKEQGGNLDSYNSHPRQLSQGFYYAFYQAFLFTEDCQAWVHGPVYRDIYFCYKDYRFDPIEKAEDFDSNVFSSGEKAIYDSVIDNLCCYSGKVLERFTHSEAPWLAARGDLPITALSDRIIDKELIGSYFSMVKAKYNMLSPGDIREYAQAMFFRK